MAKEFTNPMKPKTLGQKRFDDLLPQYLETYEKVNGKRLTDVLIYKNGWVYFTNSKVRLSYFKQMIDNLNKRAERKKDPLKS